MVSRAAGGWAAGSRPVPALRLARLGGWQVVFLATLPLYLAAGWYLAMVAGVYDGDGISRTAMAGYVVFGRDPHLGAIGFVWNPLPSLVQIPFVFLLHPFGLQIMAGPLQSAICAAATAALLWQFIGMYGLGRAARRAFVALYAANPMIVLYAANGMSEAMFIFFVAATIHFFARWAREGRHSSLVGMALMTAGAFGVRYEALALGAVGALAILIVLLGAPGRTWARLEATLLTYLTPFCYAVVLWIFFNWLIMGDPFFFQGSIYSNTAQTEMFTSGQSHLTGVIGSPAGAARYATTRLLVVCFGFVVVLAGAAVAAVRRSWPIVGVAALTLAIPAFHLYLVYAAASWGWLRFAIYAVPGAFLLAPPLLAGVRPPPVRHLATLGLLLIFAASNVLCLWAMRVPELGRQEQYYLGKIADPDYPLPASRSYVEDRAVAAYVRDHLGGQRIMLDTVLGFAIWLAAEHPEQYIIVSDRDFRQILEQPIGRADYILVPSPVGSRADSINIRYPDLYHYGLPGISLVKDFGGETGWRLFRVSPSATP